MSQSTTKLIVLVIVQRAGEMIAASDSSRSVVRLIRLVGDQIDLAEQLLFMGLEFANHFRRLPRGLKPIIRVEYTLDGDADSITNYAALNCRVWK